MSAQPDMLPLPHECDPKGQMTLVAETFDKKEGWPFRQTKTAYCHVCGAVYANGRWYDKRPAS